MIRNQFRPIAQRRLPPQPNTARPAPAGRNALSYVRAVTRFNDLPTGVAVTEFPNLDAEHGLISGCTITSPGRIQPSPSLFPLGSRWEVHVVPFSDHGGTASDYLETSVVAFSATGVLADGGNSTRDPWFTPAVNTAVYGGVTTIVQMEAGGAFGVRLLNQRPDTVLAGFEIHAHNVHDEGISVIE